MSPAPIVLSTLNARYAHASFGLRYLLANLAELRHRARLLEFDINQRPIDILAAILDHQPKIVGLGVYIWNAQQSEELAGLLKTVRPDITLILGGPEVSYETDRQSICAMADYIITGEADLAFADLCRQLLAGQKPLTRIIPAGLPDFSALALPYDLYDNNDLARRVIYVEASRGCPFKCEFCLSSLDVPVRNAPLDAFLGAMQRLLDRGLQQFKFVDRTFNLNLNTARSILRFFLDRYRPGLFLHFEMIPDRLPDPLRELIQQFPPGALQFEVGVQTFNEDVAQRISRRQDNARVRQNLAWLHDHTGVHVHADLIAGLPGEDLASFARGFDLLVHLHPQEIQLGILKRLRGTPITRHDRDWAMLYSPRPPYEILQNSLIDFPTMQRLRRFARYWDLIANSGNFRRTLPLLWGDDSPFQQFLNLTDWIFSRTSQTHAIALPTLLELLFEFLTTRRGLPAPAVAQSLWLDYQQGGLRSDRPQILKPYISAADTRRRLRAKPAVPPRQSRHLA